MISMSMRIRIRTNIKHLVAKDDVYGFEPHGNITGLGAFGDLLEREREEVQREQSTGWIGGSGR